MATTTKTVEETLKQLHEIQLIDSQIDNIKVLKGALPIEVSDLEDDISGLEKRTEKLSSGIEEIENNVARHNENIKTSEALNERYEKQLKEVKNNREFEALTKEIELQNLEVQLSQKKIKEAGEDIEKRKETLKETTDRLKSKKKDLELKKEELEKIIKKTDKEEKKLRNKSEKLKKDVEGRLLNSYEKIRTNYRNGLAVVTYHRESCGGCFNRIPPQTQIELGLKKEILACEHCGRILIDHEIAGIKEEEAA